MQPEYEIVRLAFRYQEIWHRSFPGMFRRAQWHIIRYLCTDGRQGASVGEVSGLVRQIFLLDEATVRERILSLVKNELARVEPAERNITARSIIFPTPLLLRRFEEHLLALAEPFAACVASIAPGTPGLALTELSPAQQASLLRVIDSYCEAWRAANDRVLGAQDMSQARRHEAKRHLIAPSHWMLVLTATQHHYDHPHRNDTEGVLADRMAVHLVDLLGQNFQTTRDHINYLIEIGLLERRAGKALHVALTSSAAQNIHEALGQAAEHWPATLREIRDDTAASGARGPPEFAEPDATIRISSEELAIATFSGHHLKIVKPQAARRHIPIAFIPMTIGRAAPADLLLEGANISRVHCRIEIIDGRICVTDLKSTNGTFVDGQGIDGTIPLRPGATIEIGSYVLEYEHHRPAEPEDATVTGPLSRLTAGATSKRA